MKPLACFLTNVLIATKWIKEDIQCWIEDTLKYMNPEKWSVHELQTDSLLCPTSRVQRNIDKREAKGHLAGVCSSMGLINLLT